MRLAVTGLSALPLAVGRFATGFFGLCAAAFGAALRLAGLLALRVERAAFDGCRLTDPVEDLAAALAFGFALLGARLAGMDRVVLARDFLTGLECFLAMVVLRSSRTRPRAARGCGVVSPYMGTARGNPKL